MIKIKDLVDPMLILEKYCKDNLISYLFERYEEMVRRYITKVFNEQGYFLVAINKNKIREERERDE